MGEGAAGARRTGGRMAAWEQELDALVRHRGPALVGYAYLLCGDRREAEDLVQDSLVKTFSRGRAGLRADNLEGYVRRAVLTTYVDGFRRRRRWAAVRHLLAQPDHAPAVVDGVDARHDVAAALGRLPLQERACVVLRFYEDLPLADIAEALSISVGSVKRYLHDGIRRLEADLGPLPESRAAAGEEDLTVTVIGRTR